jgi:hypothetical protein
VKISLGTYPMGPSYYLVDPETGAMTSAPAERETTEHFVCAHESASVGRTLTITDKQSGAKTRLEGIVWMPCPKTADEPLTVWRSEGPDEVTVWTGPYDRLVRVDLPLTIPSFGYSMEDAFYVLAAPKTDPDAVGFYSLAAGTLAVTEILPARAASAAVAEGGMVEGSLASARLAKPVPWPTGPGRFVYARELEGGRQITFVGPFEDGPRELAVMAVDLDTYGDHVEFLEGGPATWIDQAPAGGRLRVWDDNGRRLVSCPWLDRGTVIGWASADRRRVLVGGAPGGDRRMTALLLVSLDAATPEACQTLASEKVKSAGMSPSGARISWIGVASDLEWGLWLADGDGTNVSLAGTSPLMDDARFVSETRLSLFLRESLVWLDPRLAKPPLHYVADKTFGVPIDLEGQNVITGYDLNAQDGNGRLGLVDRDTGSKRLVSPSVSSYLWLLAHPPGDAESWWLAYVVRGRNPSSQDGLWMATIPAEDLR